MHLVVDTSHRQKIGAGVSFLYIKGEYGRNADGIIFHHQTRLLPPGWIG
jgi:hypothetical protein